MIQNMGRIILLIRVVIMRCFSFLIGSTIYVKRTIGEDRKITNNYRVQAKLRANTTILAISKIDDDVYLLYSWVCGIFYITSDDCVTAKSAPLVG